MSKHRLDDRRSSTSRVWLLLLRILLALFVIFLLVPNSLLDLRGMLRKSPEIQMAGLEVGHIPKWYSGPPAFNRIDVFSLSEHPFYGYLSESVAEKIRKMHPEGLPIRVNVYKFDASPSVEEPPPDWIVLLGSPAHVERKKNFITNMSSTVQVQIIPGGGIPGFSQEKPIGDSPLVPFKPLYFDYDFNFSAKGGPRAFGKKGYEAFSDEIAVQVSSNLEGIITPLYETWGVTATDTAPLIPEAKPFKIPAFPLTLNPKVLYSGPGRFRVHQTLLLLRPREDLGPHEVVQEKIIVQLEEAGWNPLKANPRNNEIVFQRGGQYCDFKWTEPRKYHAGGLEPRRYYLRFRETASDEWADQAVSQLLQPDTPPTLQAMFVDPHTPDISRVFVEALSNREKLSLGYWLCLAYWHKQQQQIPQSDAMFRRARVLSQLDASLVAWQERLKQFAKAEDKNLEEMFAINVDDLKNAQAVFLDARPVTKFIKPGEYLLFAEVWGSQFNTLAVRLFFREGHYYASLSYGELVDRSFFCATSEYPLTGNTPEHAKSTTLPFEAVLEKYDTPGVYQLTVTRR